MKSHASWFVPASATLLVAGLAGAAVLVNGAPQFGADNNNINNPLVQPGPDPALSGGGIDQSLQNGDVLYGTAADEVLVGRIGVDVLSGWGGDDTLIGGTEHFNPNGRDRAFGGDGDDAFLWAPGDGSDFFDGGPGVDAVVFGMIGELDANGQLVFRVSNDQLAGNVFLDPVTGLPAIDVTNTNGFCTTVDASSSPTAGAELEALDLDHLVRFFVRTVADAFANGTQTTDNGLRVTLHLRNVEVLICTNRTGGAIEAFDLTQSPPVQVPLNRVFNRLPNLASIVR